MGTRVGNYNFLYQTLIAALGYLPIKSLYAYKILSCVFDLVLAWAAGKLASTSNSGFCRGYRFAAAFGLVFLSPIVVLNSAGWAQCDSMWTSMCLLTLALLKERKPVAAMAAYGLAFAFKLQAIFLLPVIIYLWAKERTFSLLLLLEVPLVMVVTAIPALVAGRSVADIFFIYDY